MATSDRTVTQPIVNILTKAQYQGISNPSADEFYLITDDSAITAGTGISTSVAGGETLVSLDGSYGLTASDITTGTSTTNKLVSAKVIADAIAAGGSGLPDVTSSDNGKILRVVNGEWAVVELPSASGVSF